LTEMLQRVECPLCGRLVDILYPVYVPDGTGRFRKEYACYFCREALRADGVARGAQAH
jgi:hypothetical protein